MAWRRFSEFCQRDALKSFITDGFEKMPMTDVFCIKIFHGWYNTTRHDANFGW